MEVSLNLTVHDRCDFVGPVYFGSSGNQTGIVTFWNSSSYKVTAFSAGNATADATYALPTAGPAGNNYVLGSSTAGVMSWINAPGIYAPINNPTFTGVVTVPTGSVTAPSLVFGTSGPGFFSPSSTVVGCSVNGGFSAGGAEWDLALGGFTVLANDTVRIISCSGATDNDMAIQVNNTSTGISAVSVLSASANGTCSLVSAAFGDQYGFPAGTRLTLPSWNVAVLEAGGSALNGLVITTVPNAPMLFATHNLLSATIDTSQVWTFVNAPIFSALTASTVPYLNASKALTSSAVTPTQLGYLDASSSIQTQLNAKATDSLTVHLAGSENITGTKSFTASVPMQYQAGTADATLYHNAYYLAGAGGSTVGVECNSYTQTGCTTAAKQIGALDAGAALYLVMGDDGAGNQFFDMIASGNNTNTPTTVFQHTAKGTPATRTYSKPSTTNFSVTMGSGTYTVRTFILDMAPR